MARFHKNSVSPDGQTEPFEVKCLLDLPTGQPIGRILLDQNAINAKGLVDALMESDRLGTPLPQVLQAEGFADPDDILVAQSTHLGVRLFRRNDTPSDHECTRLLSLDFCLNHSILPWQRDGETLVIATARPDRFDALVPHLPKELGDVKMALCSEADIHAEIASQHSFSMIKQAETIAPSDVSCRDIGRGTKSGRIFAAATALTAIAVLAFIPNLFFALGGLLAVLSMLALQSLRIAAWIATWNTRAETHRIPAAYDLPDITIMVALFREEHIAETLVHRLTQIDYPKSRLEVLLVLEENDEQTQTLLDQTPLPQWIKPIRVPQYTIQTKPRALNYALRFARGEIIGIYDAEDAPARNQLLKVAAQFAASPAKVACLQGMLDFYNPKSNWLARCFTIEYASWFRVVLPGLARLGLAVPLGGTTVFMRRSALQAVGCWDAHNVTEDAELGIRLARKGYRTEILHSVTREEANNKTWPWIKQRSRWMKGYALTWWCHSRRPAKLIRDLGPRKFWGFQLLFLGTLMQFFLAPFLWSFWIVLLGLPHPVTAIMPGQLMIWMMGLMLCSEAASLIVFYAGLSRSTHRRLLPYVPTLFAYFPLGCIALYKALIEILHKPFYWDKTIHGISEPDKHIADIQSDEAQPTS